MIKAVKRMSLSTLVLICFALGVITGLFFGEKVAWMEGIGNAFIKLLQMTIIPYIVVSLMTSLGKMSYKQARSLGVQVGKLMLLFWIVGLLAIYLIQFIFPSWESASFFSTALLEKPDPINLIDLYIPANPFFSLSNSYIPAIVVFCVATGIALIGIKEKKALMDQLSTLGQAFNTVTGYIVKLMPIGIFSMTAATAGTMEVAEFERLQVYFAAHIIMTFLLAYAVLPVIIVLFTPFKYKDVSGIAKDAIITAFAAGNIFIVLPILIQRTKDLYAKYNLSNEDTDAYAEIIIPVVFSFPNLGKLLTIIFILFAAWFSGSELSFGQYMPMAINGLISLFGSVYLTVPMLLDSLELPSDLFQLYMVSSLLTSRFTSLLAAMNIFILAVGGTAMLTGLARISMSRLMVYGTAATLIFGATIIGSQLLLSSMIDSEYVMDDVVRNMRVANKLPPAALEYREHSTSHTSKPRSVTEIRKSGVLRVGFNPNQIPFSYFNAESDLVGFDIDLMQELARDMETKIEFIPYTLDNVVDGLNRGRFDVAVSGLQMSTERLGVANFTSPVLDLHYSFVVKDYRVDEFESDELIRKAGTLQIAAVGSYPIIPLLEKKFPNMRFMSIQSDREFFDNQDEEYDSLLISLEAGKAWTLLRPEYTTLYRRDEIKSFPASYVVAKKNVELLSFLDGWLQLQRTSGNIEQRYDYWIQGKNAVPKQPRWSVLNNVLHWGPDEGEE